MTELNFIQQRTGVYRITILCLLPICLCFWKGSANGQGTILSKSNELDTGEELNSQIFNFFPRAENSELVKRFCGDCHQNGSDEGGISLDSLMDIEFQKGVRILNQIEQQLYLGLMPPSDHAQPNEFEREQLTNWVRDNLDQFNASTLDGKLSQPEYGNYLDHDKLFSGSYAELKGYTKDRRWLISEYIFNAKINRILNHRPFQTIDGKREFVIGENNRRVPITNPFLLPSSTGVRYYANATLNAGHLLTMMANAKEMASHMTYLVKRDRRYLPAVAEIMNQEWIDEKTLLTREEFLNQHIEKILIDLYGESHEELLPTFRPSPASEPQPDSDASVKKAAFHAANPGMAELILIFQTMQRLKEDAQSDEELLRNCERSWFNFGDEQRQIEARITFLRNYLPEFRQQIETHRYAQKYKQRPYQPRDAEEMQEITETIKRHRKAGDHFITIIESCLKDWRNQFEKIRSENDTLERQTLATLVTELFQKIYERNPTADETQSYVSLTEGYFSSMPKLDAIHQLIQTLILRSEFVYRGEFGSGEADPFGRKRMSPREASFAISYALTDSSPDQELKDAAENGRLHSRDDYRREIERMLNRRDQYYVIDEAVQGLQLTASITNLPIRKLRFFREFFGYPNLLSIFKDNKRFGGHYDNSKGRLVGEADRWVEHILKADRDVFEQLLGSNRFYVYHSGDNLAMTEASDRIRRIYDYFNPLDWRSFEKEDLLKHKDFLAQVKMRGVDVNQLTPSGRRNPIREFKTAMESFSLRFDKGQTAAAPYVSFPAHGPYNASTRTGLQLRSPEVAKFFNIQLDDWDYPTNQPAAVKNRRGMLTHPAWLIAHSKNTETDPIARGKWIREKLLAGTVPDLPITVDAVLPEDHHRTLRERLDDKTSEAYCWKCHQKMNPLGLPFEIYDDFGRFRSEESLEHPENLISKGPEKAPVHVDLRDIYKTRPIHAAGHLEGTRDSNLDGPVADALDLVERISGSEIARQSIIRHAFRYFLGRNETLADSKTLIDADKAYIENGGSFDAVIISLLTSDSFIYRKAIQ